MLLGVDVGGTFTDAVLVGGDATIHTAKVPTTPRRQADGVLAAVRLVLAAAGAGPAEVKRFAHGMTVATNALLEGRTARTALIATAGFTDVLALCRQARAHLYDLCRAAPEPLVGPELRFGAPERMGPDGPLLALDGAGTRELVARLASAAPEAVAISLLHSYADASHELELAELVRARLPEVQLSLSCELVGTFREYERTATTVLDAALSPLLRDYLEQLSGEAEAIGLRRPLVMQSSGGLTDADRAGAHAALTILSGPAGGVAGALETCRLTDEPRVLCFDMGGTSCDVCLIDDMNVQETAERTVAGRPVALPALDIHTVGAGGGSIAWRDGGGALRVGPASAAAVPGPACYGRGGELPTVTDANLLLGRLAQDSPLAGGLELDRAAAERAISSLAEELGLGSIACAEGILRVAEAEMLGALRVMSVERGIDPRGFALMPFGGAGPLHAIALAEQLGITRVLCPRACGVLSALGLAAAAPRRDVSRTVMLSGASLGSGRLGRARAAIVAEASGALDSAPARLRVRHELRYRGQSFELAVDEELGVAPEDAAGLSPEALLEAFAAAHRRRYGYSDESAEVELVNIRVSAWGPAPTMRRAPASHPAAPQPARRTVYFGGSPRQALVFTGEPTPGTTLAGPAVWSLPQSTLLVPPGWRGEVDGHGTILLAREAEA